MTRNEKLEVMRVNEVLDREEDEIGDWIKETGGNRQGTETAITSRYEGSRGDDFTYLQIDVRHVPVGVHRLSVRVKDMHTRQMATREELFRVVE